MNNQIKEEGLTDAYLLGKYDGIKQGKADMLDSIIQAEKNKYYCDEDLCGESIDCSECVVRYLELLKEQMNDGTNDNKS